LFSAEKIQKIFIEKEKLYGNFLKADAGWLAQNQKQEGDSEGHSRISTIG
jgi:hypothetical protein